MATSPPLSAADGVSVPLPAGFRATTAGATARPTSTYNALLARVRDAGLLKRRTGFYVGVFVVITACLGLAVTGSILLGESWLQLLVAAALGLIFTQYAFLAHETAHRQVFESARTSDRVGHLLGNAFVGMSYSWWVTKHTRHHGNPNTVGKDPDISFDALSFREEDAAKRTGFLHWFVQRQGTLFFPLLLVEGLNLHVTSFRTVFGKAPTDKRATEIVLITLRLTAYLAVVFWFLPVGMAFAFVGVQLAVFGLYMGAAFAPNHIGMTIIPEGSRVDFLSKQVLTSRNVRGGIGMTVAMGGLDYQIEHHLFPSMARPHLRAASALVKEHCREQQVPYAQETIGTAFAIVVGHLNRVGLAARPGFECPIAADHRPR